MENKKAYTIDVSHSIIDHLLDTSKQFRVNSWDFKEWLHGETIIQKTGILSKELEVFFDLFHRILRGQGFVIINLAFLLDKYSESDAAPICTYLLSTLGSPFRVFKKHPGHWRKLGVDLKRPANRSGGVGISPLHLDFVNAANPPDIVCLLAIRHDPALGGRSIVSSFDGIEKMLSPKHVQILSMSKFSDGVVIELNGIGQDINPFPVLNFNSLWKYRFTGNLLSSEADEVTQKALREMLHILESRKITFLLERGQMLILNQHRVLHGREPLGYGQKDIPENKRRLLLQSFVRTNDFYNSN
ncbi:Fe(II)-2OG oxygenase family protein [Flavilitoribacter nigricans]|uniref:TauD/TfdA-like domain-containing protein n=1 Tax=Flavilitoribacter nigricans (strain ATCC 23147 / DSM 23189 / NBRC 102662 / NCIMB 1420 / SS-2) TaxID=1122177 RepID=A0A2D0MZN9_FLAN2|nr:hypothetical protein [Flavilitoribacter nigricans]PHN00913.1 hypothetical protein CRP01_39655 [Flavilitoribacter nigricans DSM 23189 = NBRC 102662]